MKKILLVTVLLCGCATENPFRTYTAANGTKTWSLEVRNEWRKHLTEKTDDEILARAHGHSGFCEDGYTVERVETVGDDLFFYGRCN